MSSRDPARATEGPDVDEEQVIRPETKKEESGTESEGEGGGEGKLPLSEVKVNLPLKKYSKAGKAKAKVPGGHAPCPVKLKFKYFEARHNAKSLHLLVGVYCMHAYMYTAFRADRDKRR